MLKHLFVKNFALIDDISIDFQEGFNVLSGETGAGKTLLVNALKIVLGEKVSKKFIRHGEDFAEISADFKVSSDIKKLLKQHDLISDSLIIRRKISSSGGKVYINDSLVSLQVLKSISKKLVKITSQFENQFILEKENQFKILDSYSKLEKERESYLSKYQEYQRLEEEKNNLEKLQEEKNKKLDYLLFQKSEIDKLELDLDKALEINSLISRLENQNEMVKTLNEGYQAIYDEEGVLIHLEKINSLIKDINDKNENLKIDLIDLSKIEEVGISFEKAQRMYEIDEEEVSEAIEKKEKLQDLEKKYGSIEEIFSFYEDNDEEISKLENIEQEISQNSKQYKKVEKELIKLAEVLSKKRVENSKKLSKVVEKELQSLNMGGTKFKIDIQKSGNLTVNGVDNIKFLISPNIGEPFLEMEEIVSGGELSRILLILSKYLHNEKEITYVFDEVDAGIGGETGLLVGSKLSEIGQKNQVLCITHLAQVAAKGDAHFFISKKVNEDKRTISIVKKLNKGERIKEMARLIYGTADEKSLKFAESLLK